MSTWKRKHLPVSVRQRLQNLRAKTGEDYQLLLTTYAVERLLYRLSQSEYADRFVLKGAMLFVALTGKSHRVTRDLDLLGYGDASAEHIAQVFRQISTTSVEGPVLIEAIRTTFAQRKTNLPKDRPVALRAQFAEDPVKQTQWEGFLNRSGLSDAPMKLSTVIETLNTFLTPLLSAAEEGGGYNQVWRDGGPWQPSEILGESDKIG